jgi:hypothetical protein
LPTRMTARVAARDEMRRPGRRPRGVSSRRRSDGRTSWPGRSSPSCSCCPRDAAGRSPRTSSARVSTGARPRTRAPAPAAMPRPPATTARRPPPRAARRRTTPRAPPRRAFPRGLRPAGHRHVRLQWRLRHHVRSQSLRQRRPLPGERPVPRRLQRRQLVPGRCRLPGVHVVRGRVHRSQRVLRRHQLLRGHVLRHVHGPVQLRRPGHLPERKHLQRRLRDVAGQLLERRLLHGPDVQPGQSAERVLSSRPGPGAPRKAR